METTIACIIARTNSTRLERKVLKKIQNKHMIEHIIERVKLCSYVDKIYLCTSSHEDDEVLLEIADRNGICSYAGSEESVIDRMLDVAKIENASNLIRITGDNIFTDSVYIDIMIENHKKKMVDYTRTEHLPIGVTAEIISTKALIDCISKMDSSFSQYLMLYMFQPVNYKCLVIVPPEMQQKPKWSLTVDTELDWERTRSIFGNTNGFLCYHDIIEAGNKLDDDMIMVKVQENIKWPGGVLLSIDAMMHEMRKRTEQSLKIQIDLDYYNEVLNEQQSRFQNNS